MNDATEPRLTKKDVVPDLADRMAKSLLASGLSIAKIAELLGYHRTSVVGWLNRRHPPRPATLETVGAIHRRTLRMAA